MENLLPYYHIDQNSSVKSLFDTFFNEILPESKNVSQAIASLLDDRIDLNNHSLKILASDPYFFKWNPVEKTRYDALRYQMILSLIFSAKTRIDC